MKKVKNPIKLYFFYCQGVVFRGSGFMSGRLNNTGLSFFRYCTTRDMTFANIGLKICLKRK